MLDAPPPATRPTWNAETIVLPKANVSGSTSVWCWACASVNGSLLTWVTGTFAAAGPAVSRSTTTAGATITAARSDRLRGEPVSGCMVASPSPVSTPVKDIDSFLHLDHRPFIHRYGWTG